MNNDCLYYVFSMLGVGDVVNCSFVSKRFYEIGKKESLWSLLFKRKFYNVNCTKNFYENYKSYNVLNNFLIKNSMSDVNVNIINKYLIEFYYIF